MSNQRESLWEKYPADQSNAQHTPGPWSRENVSNALVSDANGEVVAAAYDLRSDRTGEVQDANARLIAAAPDLLEALEMLASMTELFASELSAEHPDVLAARAAIAKARGQS